MAVDRRKKDVSWALDTDPRTGSVMNSDAQLAVLMDIRDELKGLNKTLNVLLMFPGFTHVPYTLRQQAESLRRIDKRLSKTRKLRGGRS